MKSRVVFVSPPAPGPHEGKRLSPWRVALGIVILAAIAAAAIFGYRIVANEQVPGSATAPWFAPYVDVTVTPIYPFEKPANDADRNVVLSFVVGAAAQSCTPSWGGAYTMDSAAENLDLDRRIARLRNQGGDVVVSFGGAAGNGARHLLHGRRRAAAGLPIRHQPVLGRDDRPGHRGCEPLRRGCRRAPCRRDRGGAEGHARLRQPPRGMAHPPRDADRAHLGRPAGGDADAQRRRRPRGRQRHDDGLRDGSRWCLHG